jgi:HAD superfamily hydrolase (TIGR01484 family)
MKRNEVEAILSDYDGTLCPTTAVRCNVSGDAGKIPPELEQVLVRISERRPVCIISSKDFQFLHKRAKFAKILSCVLGIETVIHNIHKEGAKISDLHCIRMQHLIANSQSLKDNSKLLYKIEEIVLNYKEIMIEEKYTSDNSILIGLTLDYRQLDNWKLFKVSIEPAIIEKIQSSINTNLKPDLSTNDRPFIQTYSSHPFLDVYGVECDKGLAFDNVLSHLKKNQSRGTNVMYLGDSENDNPAFRKSDISIGIRSDVRLNPILECKYTIDFDQLPLFLSRLMDNDFIFSEDLLTANPD